MKEYKVFVALKGDISAPYVWLTNPGVPSRSVARIRNISSSKSIFCEVLTIDKNFLKDYNESQHTNKITDITEAVVINEWYRGQLGLEKNSVVNLQVKVPRWQPLFYRQIRAGMRHPDNAMRIACDLAAVSVGLGLIGLFLGIISLCSGKA